MIELQNITIAEYSDLEDKSNYNFAMKYAFRFTDPVDEYNAGDITEMSFGYVKDFQYELEHNISFDKLIDFALIAMKKKTIRNEPLDKFCRFINYLIYSIKDIIQKEQIALSYEPTDTEISAGMDMFKELGIYLQIRSIAIALHMKPDEVRQMKYSDAFVELYTQKVLKEYEKNIIKLNKPA